MTPEEMTKTIDLDTEERLLREREIDLTADLVVEAPATPEAIDLTEGFDETVVPRPVPLAKRALDLTLAVIGLALSSPLWLAIAVAIKLDDRGPVFYRQKRWGRGGEVFSLLKFRTMVPDSDAKHGIKLTTENDDRITRVGKFLRATGMDEMPQFLSIARGDMSFVGPRAFAVGAKVEQPDGSFLLYEETPGLAQRLQVQPGLTGLATIYISKEASPSEKLELDLRYIEEWSFWGDLRLIFLSFWISVRGKWETRQDKL